MSQSDPPTNSINSNVNWAPWRQRMHEVIFEADTPAGKFFDVVLLLMILLSVLVVMLESVADIQARFENAFWIIEWVITGLFTIEYALRLICARRAGRYALSFYGLVDFLSILPAYVSLFITGAHSLLVIRILRLMRVFRVLKLVGFVGEAQALRSALLSSARKIVVFLAFILTIVVIMGAVMYLIEGGEKNTGFTSIPRSMYWAVVTMTTVGYGDVTPTTNFGRTVAAALMIMGYAIIAVPTGIVSAEIARTGMGGKAMTTQVCPDCSREGHEADARHCKYCGASL